MFDRCDCRNATDQFAFVVGHTTSNQQIVFAGHGKGIAVPQVKWLGGLDIVVVVAQQCRVTGAFGFGIDDGITGGRDELGIQPDCAEEFSDTRCAGIDALPLGCHAGDGAEVAEHPHEAIEVLVDIGVYTLEWGSHWLFLFCGFLMRLYTRSGCNQRLTHQKRCSTIHRQMIQTREFGDADSGHWCQRATRPSGHAPI